MLCPLLLVIGFHNFWIFLFTISIVCLFAFLEWIKNDFRHPILCYFLFYFEDSAISVLYLILIFIMNTAIFDSAAYVYGSNFGKNSIAPSISPNKTREGLIGGLLTVTIYSFLICYFLKINYLLVPICIFGGVLAFFGDLLISFHKREKNIKDTGTLLPGHGGVLDRLDSHLLAIPAMLLLAVLINIL
jgi:phosphatidate cytidylyltransferase